MIGEMRDDGGHTISDEPATARRFIFLSPD